MTVAYFLTFSILLVLLVPTSELSVKHHQQTFYLKNHLQTLNTTNSTSGSNANITTTSTTAINSTANSTSVVVPKNVTNQIKPINTTVNTTAVTPIPILPLNQTTPITISKSSQAQLKIVYLPNPQPTRQLPNPQKNLTTVGQNCLSKCKQLQGVSCKKWTDDSITCCQFTGCQWPFYCKPQMRIMVEGCVNKP